MEKPILAPMNEKIVAKSNRIQQAISYILTASIVVTFGISLYERFWLVAFACVLTFISFYLPGILAHNLKVRLPTELEFVMTAFLYAAFFLGEIQNFYERFWWWDIFLHTTSGVILGFIGFLMVYSLYSQKRLTISAFSFSFFSFCFALTLGVLWEIFEFAVDEIFGLNMQAGGNTDTMWDLIVDSLGALFTATLGFFYVKFKKSPISLFDQLLRKFLIQNNKIKAKIKEKIRKPQKKES